MLLPVSIFWQTPLHYAAGSTHGAMCLEILTNEGANVNIQVYIVNKDNLREFFWTPYDVISQFLKLHWIPIGFDSNKQCERHKNGNIHWSVHGCKPVNVLCWSCLFPNVKFETLIWWSLLSMFTYFLYILQIYISSVPGW